MLNFVIGDIMTTAAVMTTTAATSNDKVGIMTTLTSESCRTDNRNNKLGRMSLTIEL